MSPIPETGPIVNISVSTALFHPRQTRRGLNMLNTGIVQVLQAVWECGKQNLSICHIKKLQSNQPVLTLQSSQSSFVTPSQPRVLPAALQACASKSCGSWMLPRSPLYPVMLNGSAFPCVTLTVEPSQHIETPLSAGITGTITNTKTPSLPITILMFIGGHCDLTGSKMSWIWWEWVGTACWGVIMHSRWVDTCMMSALLLCNSNLADTTARRIAQIWNFWNR